MNKLASIFSALLIASILAGGMALAPTSSALADEGLQESIDQALERAFAAELDWLVKQANAIEKAYQAAAKVQEVIDRAAAEGLDITALENALATFNAAMSTVDGYHQRASGTLSTHAGFDDGGSVVDRTTARQTVMDARRALGEAHMTMTPASWDLRDALRAWRKAIFPRE